MIGVILWSNADQKRAVVWCENNGGLAYLESAADFLGAGWPDCGEIVRLSEERAAGFHYARRVTRWDDAQVSRALPHRPATRATDAAPADENALWGLAVPAL